MTPWFRPATRGIPGLTRLVGFQLTQVGLFLLLVQGTGAAVLAAVAAAVALVAIFGRWHGRWWTDVARLRQRLRARRGVTATATADPRLAALAQLVPDLAVEDVAAAEGDGRLGMGADGAGWFTVVEVEHGEVNPPVPLTALARLAAEAGQPGTVLQVVTHTRPAPGAEPHHRRLWVAVRLDADAVAASAVEDPDHPVDVPAVLAELTRRVRRVLRRRGLGSRALDADGLVDTLVLACDLAADGEATARVRETWEAWHSPRLTHRCFWLRRWPDPERGTLLLAALAELPRAQVSLALILEPYPGGEPDVDVDLCCLVRLATPPERSREAAAEAELLAHELGGRLFPLDGEHAPGVYCSAPTGGGAR